MHPSAFSAIRRASARVSVVMIVTSSGGSEAEPRARPVRDRSHPWVTLREQRSWEQRWTWTRPARPCAGKRWSSGEHPWSRTQGTWSHPWWTWSCWSDPVARWTWEQRTWERDVPRSWVRRRDAGSSTTTLRDSRTRRPDEQRRALAPG